MFKQLKELLPKAVNKQGLASQFNAIEILNVYKAACENYFDKEALLYLRPRSYKNNTLYIETENSAWSQQLHMKRSQIIKFINDKLGKEAVNNITLTLKQS